MDGSGRGFFGAHQDGTEGPDRDLAGGDILPGMDVISSCPLRVASVVWQPRLGAWMLTVVCKATYVLMPGESPLAPEQDEPNDADGYWNDEETRSLSFASDLAPFKRRADVLVVGHAFAPERRPVGSLIARLVVGEVDKAIAVFGDRAWTSDGRLQEGPRFAQMPLRWERAAGGPGTVNPVGVRMGSAAVGDRYGAVALPNLQAAGTYLAGPADVLAPVGFGPVAPRWSERVEKLYRHAAGWDPGSWNERPVPDDIDAGYFNAAPGDQQVAEIRSGERVVLENLHADHARLVTSLLQVEPRAVVERAGGSAEVRLRCDTLWIDTDRGCCSLVWRGQVLLGEPREAGRVVVTATVARAAAAEDGTATVMGGLPGGAALPFTKGVLREGRDQTVRPLGQEVNAEDASTLLLGVVAPAAALPFREGQSLLAVAARTVAQRSAFDDGTGTVLASLEGKGEALPFGRKGLAMPLAAARSEEEPVYTPEPVHVRVPREDVGEWSVAGHLPVPPAMIGPLATLEMVAAAEVPLAEAELMAVAVKVAPPPKPGLPLKEYPIERCAEIAASVARRRTEKERILEENELRPELWGELITHWSEAIRADTERGKTNLLDKYDVAYVGQLEKERGVIKVEEYAQLAVAQERGGAEATLTELTLPRGALLRIERVWLGKIASGAEFAAKVRDAVEEAREHVMAKE